VGYEEGGQLTEAVRRRPYSVVLLDEIEKAHPDVFNALLQVMDDGRLTDGMGRTVDFKNTVLVMTSNIGGGLLAEAAAGAGEGPGDGAGVTADVRERVLAVVKEAFRPEFLNRLDDIVLFNSLTREDIAAIVDIQLGRLARRLSDRRMTLTLTDRARALLADEGFDPVYGARPLRRVLEKRLLNALAGEILKGAFKDGSAVEADADGDAIVFRAL
jgi:ATP-dependent Clp protease ATP-binding subunit ClpB